MIDFCNTCNQKLMDSTYDWSIGQLVCIGCNNNKNSDIKFGEQHFSIIRSFCHTHIDELEKEGDVAPDILDTINKYLLYFLSFHIINLKYLKSIKLAI